MDGSKDDVTKAEGPNAIYRQLLGHFIGVKESIETIFPRIERNDEPSPSRVRKFCEQLLELARSSEDLAVATELMFLSRQAKVVTPIASATDLTKPVKTERKS
jgi:hypothetical protein